MIDVKIFGNLLKEIRIKMSLEEVVELGDELQELTEFRRQ